MENIKEMLDAGKQLWRYIKDAFGIGPEPEPPLISDYPPIHAVDGEIRLGSKHE